jgi:hypothetical protein
VTCRAATADDATFSVEAVMASELPVAVLDQERWEVIDEVLLADGGQYPAQMPFQKDHDRSVDANLGSVREPRRDGTNWIGRIYFDGTDPEAVKAYNKVKGRHLQDVSIGYRSTEYVDIAAGQTATVAGRQFTAAANRRLRITTKYQPKELSLCAIGADPTSKIRGEGEPLPSHMQPGDTGGKGQMDPVLRTYLQSLGLRHDATDDQAKAFLAILGGDQKVRADAVLAKTMTLDEALKPTVRKEQETPATPATPATPPSADTIRAETLRLERERVTTIRGLAGPDVDPELVTRAEDEAWTVERASKEFLKNLREGRTPAVGADTNRAPGGIVSNHERDCTRESLSMALVMRSGGGDDKKLGAMVGEINNRRAAAGQAPIKFENVAQQAQRYDDTSLLDMCREAIRLDGKQVPHGREQTIRAAVSGGSLAQIFTTSVNVMLLQAYEEEPDTTVWCMETEVADFKTNSDIRFNANAALKKVARGQTAEHATADDSAESYKVARYAKQFVVDEQDIIDDSLNAFSQMPIEFGNAAARLRPDLVYAMVLANPTMADTGAVFNGTALTTAGGHANYYADGTTAIGGPLAAGTLQLAITKMRQQYRGTGKNKVQLNIQPQFLVVPPELQFTAEILLTSAERFKDSDLGSYNPLKGKLTPVVEARLGTAGVTDPDSGTAYTGTAVNYFLFARPGLSAKVAYRRGTNRSPVLRSFVLERGQWGIGWDVNLDIGVKFTEFRGAFSAKGAA